MGVGLALVAGGFGVLDARLQDVGGGGAGTVISNMSAAYLLLAFGAGSAVAALRSGPGAGPGGAAAAGLEAAAGAAAAAAAAAAAGLAVTLLALGSFYGWQIAEARVPASLAVHEAYRWLLGGMVSGPAFGWSGHRWVRRRAWYAAAAAVLALLGERYAWAEHLGFSPGPAWAWNAEQLAGVVLAGVFVAGAARRRRAGAQS